MSGFPVGSYNKSACNAGDPGSIPRLGRSPEEKNGPTLIFLPGEFHGQRSLADYSPWGHRESDMTKRLTHTHTHTHTQSTMCEALLGGYSVEQNKLVFCFHGAYSLLGDSINKYQ